MGKPPFHPKDQVQQYTIDKLFNTGNLGAIYTVENESLLIRAPFIDSGDTLLDQFRKEVKSLLKLKHSGIVKVRETDLEGTPPWCATDLPKGDNLRQVLAQEPLDPLLSLRYIYQISDALAYAHTRDEPLCHKQLLPENIAFYHEKITILDFGLSNFGSSSSASVSSQVQQLYMPPERLDLRGRPSLLADVYSAGVIFFEMLTAHLPFGNRNDVFDEDKRVLFIEEIMDINKKAPTLHSLEPKIVNILEKSLEKRPSQRYQNAQEMLFDIKNALKEKLYQEAQKYENENNIGKALELAYEAVEYGLDKDYLQKLINLRENPSLQKISVSQDSISTFTSTSTSSDSPSQKTLSFVDHLENLLNISRKQERTDSLIKKEQIHREFVNALAIKDNIDNWKKLLDNLEELQRGILQSAPLELRIKYPNQRKNPPISIADLEDFIETSKIPSQDIHSNIDTKELEDDDLSEDLSEEFSSERKHIMHAEIFIEESAESVEIVENVDSSDSLEIPSTPEYENDILDIDLDEDLDEMAPDETLISFSPGDEDSEISSPEKSSESREAVPVSESEIPSAVMSPIHGSESNDDSDLLSPSLASPGIDSSELDEDVFAESDEEQLSLQDSANFEVILEQAASPKKAKSTENSLPKGFRWIDKNLVLCEKDRSEMIFIPEGVFIMGSSGKHSYDIEQPEHEIYLDSFLIDKYPVTWRQYMQFCEETGYQCPSPPRWGIYEDHPVVNINWFDAQAYCDWAGKVLPSEAWWEKSARGGIWLDGDKSKKIKNDLPRRTYPWGDDTPGNGLEWRANYKDDPNYGRNKGQKSTSKIDTFPAGVSPYHCFDISGNVWEWCKDWFQEDYYKHSPRENPSGPHEEEASEVDSKGGAGRVLRGGSWYTGSRLLRVTARRSRSPEGRGGSCGMRGAGVLLK